MTAVPLAVLMVVALIAGLWRRRREASAGSSTASGWVFGRIVLCALAALSVGAPPFLRAWIERGSPVYPLPLEFGGHLLAPGHPLADPGAVFGKPLESAWELVALLLFQPVKGSFVNPGLLLPVAAVLAILAAISAWRRPFPGLRWATTYCAAAGLLLVAWFTVDGTASFRTTHAAVTSGRYLLPFLAALAIAGATLRHRWTPVPWVLAILGGLWLGRPRAWTLAEAAPLAGVTALAVAISALLVIAVLRGRRHPIWIVAIAVGIGGAGTAGLEALRVPHRYALWEAAADLEDPLFHSHRLHSAYASAWPIWRALDGEVGRRIAVTAGWDGLGHNWYRYPLLGSRLQNRLFYVPLTADGSVIDYRDAAAVERGADFDAWLRGLIAEEIEVVVSLMPRWTPEDAWMRGAPDLFEPLGGDERNFHAVFALDRGAAIQRLNFSHGVTSRPTRPLRGAPRSAG